MLRRDFLAAVGSFLAGLFLPRREPVQLKAVYRREGSAWVRVRMADLKKGDRFIIEGLYGECVAAEDGYWKDETQGGILATIDPSNWKPILVPSKIHYGSNRPHM